MLIGAGLSTHPDAGAAAASAAEAAGDALGGATPSLAVVFASPDFAEDALVVSEAVRSVAHPDHLLGCIAESVVGNAREIEGGPAVAVWLAELPGEVEPFHVEFLRTAAGGAIAGHHFDPDRPAPHLMLADPYTFPVDDLLRYLNEAAPGTLIVGGNASGAQAPGGSRLLLEEAVVDDGAVGMRLDGVPVLSLVSQGCKPVGSPFTVTAAEGNRIQELGGRPPLERLQELIARLTPGDRALLQQGLHLGRVVDEYKDVLTRGDFLIRGVMGIERDSGALVVGDEIMVGETIQFHLRDAESADEDLRSMLATVPAGSVDGALLFTCNGRGSRLFDAPDHDAGLVTEALGAPLAGFFAAGEIGPIGGRNFLHGFTASLALFG